jgi:hypothetical protein
MATAHHPPAAFHGSYTVLQNSHAVEFIDGTGVLLHGVQFYLHHDLFLRAVQIEAEHWLIFDVRDLLGAEFEADHKSLPPNDHPGHVSYSLRLNDLHPSAPAFLARAAQHARVSWHAESKRAEHTA